MRLVKNKVHIISILQVLFLLVAAVCAYSVPLLKVSAQNFVVTNTNDAGAGSLRQAITDLNAQCPVGTNTITFNIPNSEPAAASDTVNGKVTYGGGVYYRIVPQSLLPKITCANAILDATTQTTFGGDSNPGQEGTGSTVGVDNIALGKVNKPEIEIRPGYVQPNIQTYGLEAAANGVTIKGFAIFGFGLPTESANVGIQCGCDGFTVEQNFLGSTAQSFTDPGASRGKANNVYIESTKNAIVRNNLIGFADLVGVYVRVGDNSNTLIEGNEIRDNNRLQDIIGPGIGVADSTNVNGLVIRNNLITGHDSKVSSNPANNTSAYHDFGLEFTAPGTGSATVSNNTFTNNSTGIVLNNGATTNVTKNIIQGNDFVGIMVQSNRNTITRNSFYGNVNGLAIDLIEQGGSLGVTLNKSGGTGNGGNQLYNFPVIEKAEISGSNITLTGWARPNTVIEVYTVDLDPSNFGEGKTYQTTFTEGTADADATNSIYGPGAINGLVQGTDSTNRFSFTVPVSNFAAGVSAGTALTATGTDANGNTSEFSGNVTVTNAVVVNTNSVDAVNDFANTQVNTPVTIGVTSNDTDPDGDSFTLTAPVASLGTNNGSVTCLSSGSCTYTPNTGYVGTDSFSYTITDSKGAADSAVVTITVASAPTPPPPVIQLGTVNGHVFYDSNNDGVQSSTEPDAANIRINISDNSSPVGVTTLTDSAGDFQSTVLAGSVNMQLDQSDPALAGYSISTISSGGTAIQNVQVANGGTGSFKDVGLYKPAPPVLTPTGTPSATNFYLGLIMLSGTLFLQYFKIRLQA